MSDYPNVQKWCDVNFKNSGIKMYPQSAPLMPMVDDLLGQIESMRNYLNNAVSIYHSLNERVTALEEQNMLVVKKTKREVKK